MLGSKFPVFFQIHDSAVTGIFTLDDVIVTSSKDATIKVWKYAGDANRNLENIHQVCNHLFSF